MYTYVAVTFHVNVVACFETVFVFNASVSLIICKGAEIAEYVV